MVATTLTLSRQAAFTAGSPLGLAASNDGTRIYAIFKNVASTFIYVSTNKGMSWQKLSYSYNSISTSLDNGAYTSICCSADGTIVYAACSTSTPSGPSASLYKSINSGATWTALTGNLGTSGDNATQIEQIVCDSTGTKLIATISSSAKIYFSSNGATSWTYITPTNNLYNFLACSSDATTVFVNSSNTLRYFSVTWSPDAVVTGFTTGDTFLQVGGTNYAPTTPRNWISMSSSTDGNRLYATYDQKLQVFTKTTTWSDNTTTNFYTEITTDASSTSVKFNRICSYNTGYNLVTYNSIGTPTTYLAVYIVNDVPQPPLPPPPICFRAGSMIKCNGEYRAVETLKKGDLVETMDHGLVAVDVIGTSILPNHDDDKPEDRMYVLKTSDFPELTQDLYLTGGHSLLVDKISVHQVKEILRMSGAIFVTDKKLRLFTCLEEKAILAWVGENVPIYHLCLENADPELNYGIYANGLLVETCQKSCIELMKSI